MKCFCCDKRLSDYEATLRHAHTGEFLDTCVKCLKGLAIPTQGREDLLGKQEPAEEEEEFEEYNEDVWFQDTTSEDN